MSVVLETIEKKALALENILNNNMYNNDVVKSYLSSSTLVDDLITDSCGWN